MSERYFAVCLSCGGEGARNATDEIGDPLLWSSADQAEVEAEARKHTTETAGHFTAVLRQIGGYRVELSIERYAGAK